MSGYASGAKGKVEAEYLGAIDELPQILKKKKFDEAVIALNSKEAPRMTDVIRICELEGLRFSIIPYFNKHIINEPTVQTIGDITLLDISSSPLDSIDGKAVKSLEDFFGALVAIVLSSPIMLIAAVGTAVTSGFPIIFRQKRVGRDSREFEMYKFRTMRQNREQDTAWSRAADDRRTPFGRFLRKTSIDELPQLFNVLKGDMSLVGPRPEIPYYVDSFKSSVPYYMLRHYVKPGMTGWAQVNGLRGDTSIEERVKYDVYYIDHWTPVFDLRILFKTLFGGIINDEKL